MRNRHIENVIHLLMGLTYGETAYRIAVQIHVRNGLGMLDPDGIHNAALVDTEQKLLFVDGIRQGI